VPGQPALEVASDVFARLTPTAGTPAPAPAPMAGATQAGTAAASGDPIEAAWRRFVGDRRRMTELDYFINLAKSGQPQQRTLAYAVLIQSIRTPRTPAPVREKVAPVIEAAWSDPASAPSLVQAIGVMRMETQYTDKLAAYTAAKSGGK